MTDKVKTRASRALLHSWHIFYCDDRSRRYAPHIFIVGDSVYWFLNAARRAAYCERKPIEVLTLQEAYQHENNGKQLPARQYKELNIDLIGETFGFCLFCNSYVRTNDPSVKQWEKNLTQEVL